MMVGASVAENEFESTTREKKKMKNEKKCLWNIRTILMKVDDDLRAKRNKCRAHCVLFTVCKFNWIPNGRGKNSSKNKAKHSKNSLLRSNNSLARRYLHSNFSQKLSLERQQQQHQRPAIRIHTEANCLHSHRANVHLY